MDYVKAHVYRDKHEKDGTLEAGIEELIRQIPADMSKRVCQIGTSAPPFYRLQNKIYNYLNKSTLKSFDYD